MELLIRNMKNLTFFKSAWLSVEVSRAPDDLHAGGPI